MKSILRGVGFAVIATGVTVGCTGILGSFEVAPGGPELGPDGDVVVDGMVPGRDGSPLSDGAPDASPPLTCKAGETKCVAQGKCALLGSDAENCGKCGRSCGGSLCTTGACAPVKVYEAAPLTLGSTDVGDQTVYFTTSDGNITNKLYSCPSTGCVGAPKQLALMQYEIRAIAAVNKANVTFLSAPTQSTERPAIFACPPAGCPTPPGSFVLDGLNGIDSRVRPAPGGRVIFNTGGTGLGSSICALVPGGACTSPASFVGVKGTHGLTADATNFYFVDSALRGSTIAKCAFTEMPCVPTSLVTGDQSDVEGISVSDGHLFWIKPGRDGLNEGKLFTCDLPACSLPKLVANGLLTSPTVQNELYVDGSGAYWFNTSSKLQRCAAGGCIGGAQDFVAAALDTPHSIVSDSDFIYWAEKTSLWRLAK